jgi:hypothetical protein
MLALFFAAVKIFHFGVHIGPERDVTVLQVW